MAKLADALVLGTSVFGREGSTPSLGTQHHTEVVQPAERLTLDQKVGGSIPPLRATLDNLSWYP